MAYAVAEDGTRLFYETTGDGTPLLFIHEFAGDHRSWEPQLRHFSDRYRCLSYAARGYEPSDVPDSLDRYSQATAVSDAVAVLDAAGVDRAHIVGVSMGGFTALHLGMQHPDRVRSLVVGGCGYGSQPEKQAGFREECEAIAVAFESEGAAQVAKRYAVGPARVQFQNKDPRGWAEFASMLAEHSSTGSALTMRGVQKSRPSLYDLRDQLGAMEPPTLIIAGDEDEGCLEPDLMLKRTIPTAGLVLVPRTGHTVNLEEPEQFNRAVDEFLSRVENQAWRRRDPRSLVASTTGMR
jgi:pimeloyl-ACP methyl ester carboxylesterase